ncbi:uncharacterized protein LOC122260703 isoform X2 [Penaeus japonicus]|uniref:uncharacterized protein LOC122259036 isoform X3 n=1 Tax=Penaeus japonicus TaxID=27405 RepID=UPI001C71080C|nr:uncharacterized protein LOC122259036 isoform X3 [Penaeus japonicus]XP_042884026.1 uncharacterized protein LOC122260703 isoform X2 [Penaeus japonicus]
MPAGFAETPLNEDHASSEEPTMPTLVEEGLTSSMLRDPLQINDNDDYSSPEEPTMPKLTIEGIITNTSADITSPVSATLRKAVPSLVKTARKENPHMLNGVTSGSSAQPEQECKENVKGSKKSDVQTTSVGRNKRRTKTTLQTSLDSNDKCDVETGKSHHLRKVTKHSCNICQSTNSATPKRSHPECDASASKRNHTKENPDQQRNSLLH